MANNYCESSTMLHLTAEQIESARDIVNRVTEAFENDPGEGSLDVLVEVHDDGVWIAYDESFNPDHAETLAKELLVGLEIDEPFVISWAYTCSKPRLDEFGGGACVVRRNEDTVWFDAQSLAQKEAERATS